MNSRKKTIQDMFVAKYNRLPEDDFEKLIVDFISKISDVYDKNFDEKMCLSKKIKEMKIGLKEKSLAIKNRHEELMRREEVLGKIGSYCRSAVRLNAHF